VNKFLKKSRQNAPKCGEFDKFLAKNPDFGDTWKKQ